MDGQQIFYCGKNSEFLTLSLNSNGLSYTGKKLHSKSKRNPYSSKKLKEIVNPRNELVSLRELCASFVVDNFHLVDSLVGFPELVGEELFKKCSEIGYFEIDCVGNWKEVLAIFIEAYSDKILQYLFLSHQPLFLSIDLEYIMPYTCLKEIDFSYCKIGDTHEILTHLGTLNNLEVLNLSHNQITPTGVKNLTMNYRRRKTGLEKLKQLRLDGNNLKEMSFLPFLQELPCLVIIIVDNNYKSYKTSNPTQFSVCPHSIRFHGILFKRPNEDNIGTGWAVPLILNHIVNLNKKLTKQKENLNQKSEEIKKKFYKNKPNFSLNPNPIIPNASNEPIKNHVILCKCAINNPRKATTGTGGKTVERLQVSTAQKRTMPPTSRSSKIRRLNSENIDGLCEKDVVSIDKSILDLYR